MRPLFALALAATLLAGGCITVFPKAEPARLYKLSPPRPDYLGPAAGAVILQRAPVVFTRSATGDQIITVVNNEVASIAGARWSAPAQLLFEEALVNAFDGSSRVRLQPRAGPTPTGLLRVEVRTFEARYLAGPESAPTVVIEARAAINGLTREAQNFEEVFRSEVPASENRVGPIVDAYNAATGEILSDIVAWSETVTAGSGQP